MEYHHTRIMKLPFDKAVEKITKSLQEQGFGILTTINVHDVFKKKLEIDFRKYTILGACNPNFAHQAISLDPNIGVLLPCNVLLQEHEGGEVEISAVNPMETIGKNMSDPLQKIAIEVSHRLRQAVYDLQE